MMTWELNPSTFPVSCYRGLYDTVSLSEIPIGILSAPVSSTETERSFTTFSFIHNNWRNKLTTERAWRIISISHNWKLQYIKTLTKANYHIICSIFWWNWEHFHFQCQSELVENNTVMPVDSKLDWWWWW